MISAGITTKNINGKGLHTRSVIKNASVTTEQIKKDTAAKFAYLPHHKDENTTATIAIIGRGKT